MKAVVYTEYGTPDVLQIKEVEKPTPADNQVLVKVYAASANALDYRRFESQSMFGRLMDTLVIKAINKILGADIAGTVESVGAAVKQFQAGDAVFGVASGSVGGFAEYACASENGLALKPGNLSFEEAASVPVAALTALQGLRDKGQIQAGQKVLINGASGGVGTFTIQLAKYFGAEVTAVCSPRNLEIVRQIGADQVIDYTQEDFTKNGQHYDLIVAVNGYHPLLDYRRSLTPNGVYVAIGGTIAQVLQAMILGSLLSKIGNQKMGFMGIARTNKKDLVFLAELLAAGKIVPVIDSQYPLDEVVEAIKYLAEGHARGKVVFTVGHH